MSSFSVEQKHSIDSTQYFGLIVISNQSSFLKYSCYFISDAHQPLSQIRMNLAGSLGAGQVIFLASINATENTVRNLPWFLESL